MYPGSNPAAAKVNLRGPTDSQEKQETSWKVSSRDEATELTMRNTVQEYGGKKDIEMANFWLEETDLEK